MPKYKMAKTHAPRGLQVPPSPNVNNLKGEVVWEVQTEALLGSRQQRRGVNVVARVDNHVEVAAFRSPV